MCICCILQTSMGYAGEDGVYAITGQWDPTESSFAVLNTETPRGESYVQ